MTRHGKNATASAVYSYHERKKDTAEGEYGTQSAKITQDSARNFDCCCLTLQPCKDPVVTPDGYLFEREAILTNLLKQKRKIAKQEKAYAKQCKEKSTKFGRDLESEKFLSEQSSSSAVKVNEKTHTDDNSKKLNNFWVNNLQGHASKEELKKPDTKTYCPITNKQLRLKDLITVKFTEIPHKESGTSLICRESRYMCAVTHDTLSNAITSVVLKPSGNVITLECYERLVKKDMIEPLSGEKLKEKDVIMLKRGSTGYAGATNTGEGLIAKKKGAVLMAN
jgi:nitric oxide synthase-interacting protein